MKKVFLTLCIVLLAFSLTACGGTSSLPDTFDFMYNEDGVYIQLGMTREEVEQLISFDEEFAPSDRQPGGWGEVSNEYFTFYFDENDIVISIMTAADIWSARGGIVMGSTAEEIIDVFGEGYTNNHAGTFLTVSFTSEHIPRNFGRGESGDYTIFFQLHPDDLTVFLISIEDSSIHR